MIFSFTVRAYLNMQVHINKIWSHKELLVIKQATDKHLINKNRFKIIVYDSIYKPMHVYHTHLQNSLSQKVSHCSIDRKNSRQRLLKS